MPAVLGVNAVFHDPAAALVVDGEIVAAAEEERFSPAQARQGAGAVLDLGAARAGHGAGASPRRGWSLPTSTPSRTRTTRRSRRRSTAMSRLPSGRACGRCTRAGRRCSCARACPVSTRPGSAASRTTSRTRRRPPSRSRHGPLRRSRRSTAAASGPRTWPAGSRAGGLEVLAAQALPHSLGLLYEELTAHLGFRRSSDEYKVMAMASYGRAVARSTSCARLVRADGRRRLRDRRRRLERARTFTRRRRRALERAHADLAASVQRRLEEVLLDLAAWLHARTGGRDLAMAGGVALNCVANSRSWREGAFERIWVQPAAGDAGTALGAALHVAAELGDDVEPMRDGGARARLGRRRTRAGVAHGAACRTERTDRHRGDGRRGAGRNGVVAWFQGRSEYGPRALGHRSLLARPARARQRGAAQRRQGPRAVPAGRADGARRARARDLRGAAAVARTCSSRTRCDPAGRERIPAVVHVDGTARIQTVDPVDEPLVARMLTRFERAPACRSSSTRASTPPGGRSSTTRATRSSASARPRSTCSRSARSRFGAGGRSGGCVRYDDRHPHDRAAVRAHAAPGARCGRRRAA